MIESRTAFSRITKGLIVLALLVVAAVCIAPLINTIAISFSHIHSINMVFTVCTNSYYFATHCFNKCRIFSFRITY